MPLQKAPGDSTLPEGFATWSVIGSDEVGNGAYFGPLTVAAAYVSKENIATLKSDGRSRFQRYDGRPN